MSQIWIAEESISTKFLDDLGHHMRLDGELETAYFVSADGEDYIEENKNFLLEFLIHRNKYPLFVTFNVYDEQAHEYITFLNQNNIEFILKHLDEKKSYYDFSGRHLYHPPCFTAMIHDPAALSLLLNETYWLPSQNEFYSISFSDNLTFELGEVREWGRKKKRSIPTFKMEEETAFITIYHDGAGFNLFSNEDKDSSLDRFISNLPKGTVITQINDRLTDE
ncbi:hypothetical protein [Bacillus sp. SJS]|uniref:hypothetical protein n=1 Tax=Bacillus sp. SJS TaxID=1423321 RepID=UPI0004DD6EEF|nr:hypothetical protein [Bacillus sp. SJS]KZZ85454.1 hypothetical protein AS29_005800 [Bacillus sp. SJS]